MNEHDQIQNFMTELLKVISSQNMDENISQVEQRARKQVSQAILNLPITEDQKNELYGIVVMAMLNELKQGILLFQEVVLKSMQQTDSIESKIEIPKTGQKFDA